MPYLSFKI